MEVVNQSGKVEELKQTHRTQIMSYGNLPSGSPPQKIGVNLHG